MYSTAVNCFAMSRGLDSSCQLSMPMTDGAAAAMKGTWAAAPILVRPFMTSRSALEWSK